MTRHLDMLYKTVILEHSKHPKNKMELSDFDVERTVYNPMCGDTIKVQIKVKNQKISTVAFNGEGCAISQASASVMTDLLQHMEIKEAKERIHTFKQMLRGDSQIDLSQLEDGMALQGVVQFPARIRCAQIAWQAVEEAIDTLESSNALDEMKENEVE